MVAVEFFLVIALTRFLGLEQYGVYAFFYSIARIVAIPLSAGLPSLTVRQVAYYVAEENWGLLRGFLLRTNQMVLISFAIVLATTLIVVAAMPEISPGPILFFTLAIVPLMALANIRGATLRGMQYVVLGQLPESVIRPILFVAFVMLASVITQAGFSAEGAMFLHLIACLLTFAYGAYILYKRLPEPVRVAKAEYRDREWLQAFIPFSMISGAQVLNDQIGIFSVGMLDSTSGVGLFQIALQISLVVGLPITALNISLAPHFARLHQLRQLDELKVTVGFASFTSFAFAITVAIFLLFFGQFFLELVFGPDFKDAYVPMMVLVSGQVVSAATGSLFPLTKMLGEERIFSIVLGGAAIANLIVCLLMVPVLGPIGAALGSALSIISMNVILAVYIYRKLGINSLPSLRWLKR